MFDIYLIFSIEIMVDMVPVFLMIWPFHFFTQYLWLKCLLNCYYLFLTLIGSTKLGSFSHSRHFDIWHSRKSINKSIHNGYCEVCSQWLKGRFEDMLRLLITCVSHLLVKAVTYGFLLLLFNLLGSFCSYNICNLLKKWTHTHTISFVHF